ncbi:MAG: DNA polymerase III subunit delta [Aquificae bacterium]|nr:DNA polymerase III subunit delta [Aquificota bacterium]
MEYKLPQYLKAVLEKGSPSRINLVHGEEEYLVKALTDKLREAYGEGFTLLWGDEVSLEDLYEACAEGSIFSSQGERVVFLLGFEDFLKKLGKKRLSSFLNFLKGVKSSKVFLVVGRKLTKAELSKEPYKTISVEGDIILADKLPKAKVKDIVRKKFEREAGGIEEEALELMVEMCQGNLMVLRQESEKLISYAGRKKITTEDVRKVCTPWGEYSLFDLVDAFFEGDLHRSLTVLRETLRQGVPPLQIMSTLASYITKIFTVQVMTSRGVSLDNALESVRVKHQYAKLKFKNYLEKVPKEKAEELLERIYRLDYMVKVAFSSPERELEKLMREAV